MSELLRWVGTWTTSPVVTEGIDFNNQTLRMIVRASLGGTTVRARLSNACGRTKLAIGAAHIALRDKGASIVEGSDRKLTFAGRNSCTIPAGALLVSDAVELDVPPLAADIPKTGCISSVKRHQKPTVLE